jgi:hypothetical protein
VLGFQDNATEWADAATPVPDSAMFAGELFALLVIVSFPVKLPMLYGVNEARTVVV